MAILSKSSSSPGTALFYITFGSLMTIWGAVWYFAFLPEDPRKWVLGLCAGIFLSGVAFLVIGFTVGRITREVKRAEAEPVEPEANSHNIQGIQSR